MPHQGPAATVSHIQGLNPGTLGHGGIQRLGIVNLVVQVDARRRAESQFVLCRRTSGKSYAATGNTGSVSATGTDFSHRDLVHLGIVVVVGHALGKCLGRNSEQSRSYTYYYI